MKTIQRKGQVSQFAVLAVLTIAGLAPSLASANTAANTALRNIVTVSYADANAVAQPTISDEVDVVVQLVAATPSLNAPDNQTIAPSSTAIYNYTITTNANGPDDYNIDTTTTPVTETAGLSGSTGVTSTALVTLGATTVASNVSIDANTDTAISVPSDASDPLAPDDIVNGIAALDTVVINNEVCSVISVVDSGTPATGAIANSSITVNCPNAVNATVSMLIREQQTFTMTATPNGWTPPGPEHIYVTVTAEDSGAVEAPATDDTDTTVEQLLSVVKYVRNVTTNAAGAGATATDGVSTFYETGVVAVPQDRLEYLIVITNDSTANSATDTVISDPVPPFTTFTNAGVCANSFAVLDNALNITNPDPAADNGDEGELVGTTVYLYPGSTTHGDDDNDGVGNPNGDGGTIVATENAYGRFCVSVD